MKKAIFAIIIIALVVLAWWQFGSNTPAVVEETGGQSAALIEAVDGQYGFNTGSTITWRGRKPLKENYEDVGTVAVKEGNVVVENGAVTGGTVVFDMNTISAVSTGVGGGETQLTSHLKSADFFDVETHQTATFVVTSVEPLVGVADANYQITGTLTIKGIDQEVVFPALLSVNEDNTLVSIKAKTVLDRTLWDVRFGSGKFFENLADNLIADDFEVELDLATTAR